MTAHIEDWHTFASVKLGIDVPQEGLIFVSGYTKTSVWAVTAFNGGSTQGELIVSGGWPVAVSGDFRVSMSRSVNTSVFSRTGPSHRLKVPSINNTITAGPDTAAADQCIFLNYHKAKKRRKWQPLKVMKAAAGPHDPDSQKDHDNQSQ